MKTLHYFKLVAISSIMSIQCVFAQSELFKVLATKGQNKLVNSSSESTSLLIGKKLMSDDYITVSDKGYIGLVHNPTGKTIELKVAGTYKVKDLTAKLPATNAGFTEKYSKYVLAELTDLENSDVSTFHRKNMKVTGSVDRALNINTVTVCLPKTSSVIEEMYTINWRKNAKVKTYTVEVTNMFEELLYSKEISDTILSFKISDIKLPKDNNLMIFVKGKENPEIKSAGNVLKFNKSAEINTENKVIKNDFDESNALNCLVKASFYKMNNLFLDAKNQYEKAITIEPEVDEYKMAYKTFLEKNGLNDFYPYYSK